MQKKHKLKCRRLSYGKRIAIGRIDNDDGNCFLANATMIGLKKVFHRDLRERYRIGNN